MGPPSEQSAPIGIALRQSHWNTVRQAVVRCGKIIGRTIQKTDVGLLSLQCSILQCIAVYCILSQCTKVFRSVLQFITPSKGLSVILTWCQGIHANESCLNSPDYTLLHDKCQSQLFITDKLDLYLVLSSFKNLASFEYDGVF